MTLRLGYFPNVTHAPGARRRGEGHLRQEARHQRQAGDEDLQRRPGRDRGDLRRRARRHATSARTRRSTPAPSPRARPSGSSPAPRRAARTSSSSPAITSAADLKGKKIATPQLGNTQDVALRYWLKQQGPQDRHHRAAATSRSCRRTTRRRSQTFTDRRRSTAPGCPSRAPPAWSTRAAARCSSTSATCGRTASSSPPTCIVRTKFLKAHPDVVKKLLEGQVDGRSTFINDQPGRGAAGRQRPRSSKLTGKPLEPDAARAGVSRTSTFTNDPIASSLHDGAEHAEGVGLLEAGRPQRASTT